MDESSVKSRMQEVVSLVTSDVASIRTGKANSNLVSDLEVTVYGGQQKLKINELGTVSTPDPESVIIDPWDKSVIGEIKKGIEVANVGLNPQIDGEIIRISIPPMTSEDRNKFVKLLGTKIESGKVMARQVRAEALKSIRSAFEDKELTEDDKFNEEKRLQDITDKFVKKIEEIGEKKKQELLSV